MAAVVFPTCWLCEDKVIGLNVSGLWFSYRESIWDGVAVGDTLVGGRGSVKRGGNFLLVMFFEGWLGDLNLWISYGLVVGMFYCFFFFFGSDFVCYFM